MRSTIQIGTMANGQPITMEVEHMFPLSDRYTVIPQDFGPVPDFEEWQRAMREDHGGLGHAFND